MTKEEFDKADKVKVGTLATGAVYWHRSKFDWAYPHQSVFVEPKNDRVVVVWSDGHLWEYPADALVVPVDGEVRDVDELEILELPAVPDIVRR